MLFRARKYLQVDVLVSQTMCSVYYGKKNRKLRGLSFIIPLKFFLTAVFKRKEYALYTDTEKKRKSTLHLSDIYSSGCSLLKIN